MSNYTVLSPRSPGVEAQTHVTEESQLYKPNNQETKILKYSKLISSPQGVLPVIIYQYTIFVGIDASTCLLYVMGSFR